MTPIDDEAAVFRPLPGRTTDRSAAYEAVLHDLVRRAVEIARTSDDEYLRHRVEIQAG